jgi:hypothetical protein
MVIKINKKDRFLCKEGMGKGRIFIPDVFPACPLLLTYINRQTWKESQIIIFGTPQILMN